MNESQRKAMFAKTRFPNTSFGYVIRGTVWNYDKSGFETASKALRSAKTTVRNLQKRDEHMRLDNITLTINTDKKNSDIHRKLIEYQNEEIR